MAEKHKRGHIKGEPSNPVCECNGGTYFNCGANCECCDNMSVSNPTNTNSFGFNNKFDGRVRGGIKTPNAFTMQNSVVGKEFNIFEENIKNNNMNYQNKGFNVNPNRSNGRTTRIAKKHPLDVLRQKRVMGATVYDPVTKTWKIDDLRPRGWDEVGKIACWGQCKVRRRWWLGGTQVSCNCNKANDGGCKCDGCLGGAGC